MENNDISQAPFGEVLKTYRKQKKITQRQLAEKLGVHYNTVWAWECGDHLPETKGMVLELAKHLLLNDHETGHLLKASLTALSPYWHVPYLRNAFFTGRAQLLQQVHACLQREHMVILSGLGGIGKTQTALKYVYQQQHHYAAVFWVTADTPLALLSSFVSLAEVLDLPEKHVQDQHQVLAAVKRWLVNHRDWLLVVDNVEDLEVVKEVLPAFRHGAILLTTRIQASGTFARSIEVELMPLEEGIPFLLRRSKLLGPDESCEQLARPTYQAAQTIVEALNGLPLALDQAAAYIDETQCNLSDFLQLFQSHLKPLLAARDVHEEHPLSVAKTFALAFQKIQQKNTLAAEVLTLCAFLAPDSIPEDIFLQHASLLGDTLPSSTNAALLFNAALKDLRAYSLVRRNAQERTLSIHRLVQIVLREEMNEQERGTRISRLIGVLNALFPEVTHDVWGRCERLLSHVLACVTAISDEMGNQELADVLRKAADYLYERAQYEQAGSLYQRALHIREQVLGPEHPQVADAAYGLAKLYAEHGKYTQAEPLVQRALHIREQILGPEHPQVAETLNGLANVYYEQGKFEQAEPLFQRALRIWEQALGPGHPEVAYALNGLAIVYVEQGKFGQAEQLYLRSLRIREQTLGLEHPQVAWVVTRLAVLYRRQWRFEQAELLYQRALRIREQVLGSEHPQVALSLYGLAYIYAEQGKFEQAEPLYLRTLCLREQALGPEHRLVADALNGLANLYMEQGKFEQAEPLFQRALRVWEQALGSEHPDVAYALNGLANLYVEQRKFEQAEPLYLRSLRLREQAWGSEHHQVASSLNGLATLYCEQGKYEAAKSLYQRALVMRERHLDQHHPETAQTLHDLATCSQRQGDLDAAIAYFQRALVIRSQLLGHVHPKTVATRTSYTTLLQIIGRQAGTADLDHMI